MKIKNFLLIFLMAFFIIGCGSDTPEKEEKVKEEFSEDPYLDFNIEHIISSTREEDVIRQIREMSSDYRDAITHIRMSHTEEKNTLKEEYNNKISEQERKESNQRDLYNEHCYEHSINPKEDFECEETQQRLLEAQEKAKELSQEKEERVAKIDEQEEESLDRSKNNYVGAMKELSDLANLELSDFFEEK